eukprot:m.282664 g.282664  ORF g.282664 m.282664 type:complete len:329 (+) comp11115_c0_seq2:2026-3012(+)
MVRTGRVSIAEAISQEERSFPRLLGYPVHTWERPTAIYVAFMLVQATYSMVVSIYALMGMTLSDDRPAIAHATALLLNQLFVIGFVLHGTLRDKQIQLLAVFVIDFGLAGYDAWDYYYHPDHTVGTTLKTLKFIRLLMSIATLVVNLSLGAYVTSTLDRLNFLIGGAFEATQSLYRHYTTTVSILVCDLQAALSFVCVSVFSTSSSTDQLAILISGVVLTSVWLAGTLHMLRREVAGSFYVAFLLFALSVPAFAGYKIYWMEKRWDKYEDDELLTMPMILFGLTALALRVASIVLVSIAVRNFGKGLKQHLDDARRERTVNETRPLLR